MNVDDSSPSATKRLASATVAPTRLFEWLASGRHVFLLDIREPTEIARAKGSIPGSRAIPVHQLFLRRKELPPTKTTPVIVISAVEERARAAVFTLAMLGYTNVRILEGGIEAWSKSRLPHA